MNNYYQAKKANFSERINISLLMKLTPDGVYSWMKDNHTELELILHSDWFNTPENRTILEYCLYRRNEPLIDLSLALYGYTTSVLKRVFNRGDVGTRLAALANPKGSVQVKGDDFWNSASDEELKAFFSNTHLIGGLFTTLFNREHKLKGITHDRFLKIVTACTKHPRLNAEYDDTFMDGYAEWEYHNTFEAAWNLANTVPVTKEWAYALDGLLSSCIVPVGFTDPLATIKRWDIPEDFKEGDSWYSRGPFFQIRTTLAKLLKEDELMNSEDPALRMGYYRIFKPDPKVASDLRKFFDRDGTEFVCAAMYNKNIWKVDHVRDLLRTLSWACPDPSSLMDIPNMYRGAEKHFKKLHPEWFSEVADWDDQEPVPDPTGEALTALQAQLRSVEQSLTNYVSKLPSGAGWWVVAALLMYLIFSRG